MAKTDDLNVGEGFGQLLVDSVLYPGYQPHPLTTRSILSALGAGSPPPPPASCVQAKIKAASKKASSKLKCWAKALGQNTTVDPTCLPKAEMKFSLSFAKAETKTGCAQIGDANTVESAVDSCVSNLAGLLPGPSTTTTTSPVSTTTLPTCSGSEPASLAGTLAAQNDVRANASPTPVPPLDPFCWSDAAAANAQAWADGCNYGHNPNLGTVGYGENIYAAAYTGSMPPPGWNPPVNAVDSWASEAADYDFSTNSCSSVCGHYTQLVWRDTEAVGCGIKVCTTNSPFGPSFPTWTFVVCDYNPPGNFVGQQPY
jgi:pathogenesis-related protein 1